MKLFKYRLTCGINLFPSLFSIRPNAYFYFFFSPHFIMLVIIAIMSIMRISDQVDDLKVFLVKKQD